MAMMGKGSSLLLVLTTVELEKDTLGFCHFFEKFSSSWRLKVNYCYKKGVQRVSYMLGGCSFFEGSLIGGYTFKVISLAFSYTTHLSSHSLSRFRKVCCFFPCPVDHHFSNLTLDVSTANQVNLTFELIPSLSCLRKTHPHQAIVSICQEQLPQEGGANDNAHDDKTACDQTSCKQIHSQGGHGIWDSEELMGGTLYQFTTIVSYTFDNVPTETICDTQSMLEVLTPEGSPASPPENVSFSRIEVGEGNFTLSWLPPPLNKRNGHITHYVVWVNTSDEENPLQNFTTEEQNYSQKFDPSLDYTYAVAACTNVGCGPYSGPGYYNTSIHMLSNGSAHKIGT